MPNFGWKNLQPSTYDLEMLAVYCAVKHFKYVVDNRSVTDRKLMTFVFKKKHVELSLWQLRHLDYIGQFTTDIQFESCKDNCVADAFSCIECISVPSILGGVFYSPCLWIVKFLAYFSPISFRYVWRKAAIEICFVYVSIVTLRLLSIDYADMRRAEEANEELQSLLSKILL